MYKILEKEILGTDIYKMVVDAPYVAKKAEAGQFIILRTDEVGERIPLTIADYDRNLGTITIIFQTIGASTKKLSLLNVNDFILDFAGPLGVPTKLENLKKIAIIGGGVGSAIAYPVAKKAHSLGIEVHSITGFRGKEFVILEEEFKNSSNKHIITTDDGSYGTKGLVTEALKSLIDSGEKYDEVIAIGPLVMMKFVSLLTKEYNIKTSVSMNPIMIDGTGMCGGCRLTVDGKTKFACVDGPDFDGHSVDFDELMKKSKMYAEFEKEKDNHICNLMNMTQEV